MLELIAAGCVGAVASAAGTVILMRRNLAKDRADLIREQDELDHAGDMQDLRHADLAQWAGWLATETDRVNRWDAYIASLPAGFLGGPDMFDSDPEPVEPLVELAPVNRDRFAYDPTAADRVHTVARPEAAEVLVGEQSVLFAEKRELEEFAATVAPTAEFVGEHFESDALSAEIEEILKRVRWRTYKGGELTAALIAEREGMPTGQYAAVGNRPNPDQPANPQQPSGPPAPTRLIGQPRVDARVLHAIAKGQPRPQDEMPTPMPQPSPAVAGPRPGTNTDTDGRPTQPKPSTVGAAA